MSRLLSALVFCILCLTFTTSGVRMRYDNYHVYRLLPQNLEELAVVKNLEHSRDSFIFLDAVHYVNSKINVIVAPQSLSEFLITLQAAGIEHELLDENAQSQLEAVDYEVADANRRTDDYNWKEYHELNDTYNWLNRLAEEHPKQVTTFVAGQTYEGRDILGLRISYGSNEKSIFLEGGMHAREWISPATTTYITHQLLTSSNKEVRRIAENFDWYIVPHANPDGFVYTHSTDRLWRKTRAPYEKSCFGADPNRNWDFHWNDVGSSNNPCSDTYAGPNAFSEIETRSLANFLETLKGKLFLYVSFHAYSQLLLFPYGHTGELPPNYADLKRVFDVALAGVERRHGTKYTGGNIYDAIYPASGASVDWAYDLIDVPYSYCYELRPSGKNFWTGFKLPAKQIIPTGEETLDSLVDMIKEASIKRVL